jgi:hypothetical protein
MTLLEELMATKCRCRAAKLRNQTFCRLCYLRLPRALQRDLYKRLGDGYEEAYHAAVDHLASKDKKL